MLAHLKIVQNNEIFDKEAHPLVNPNIVLVLTDIVAPERKHPFISVGDIGKVVCQLKMCKNKN